jgi:tRNA(adenine34) deaminase
VPGKEAASGGREFERIALKEDKEDIVHMPVGLFAMDPETIATSLASREVSPQGPATGMRVLKFYLTRASRQLSPLRRKRLEKARKLLSVHVEKAIKEEERREREQGERRRIA